MSADLQTVSIYDPLGEQNGRCGDIEKLARGTNRPAIIFRPAEVNLVGHRQVGMNVSNMSLSYC